VLKDQDQLNKLQLSGAFPENNLNLAVTSFIPIRKYYSVLIISINERNLLARRVSRMQAFVTILPKQIIQGIH
jgi:hypothetical protein